VPDERDLLAGGRRELRAVVEAKEAEAAMLRAELAAERDLRRRLELRLAELERRLGMDSTNPGTPTSKEAIGAKERRGAAEEAGFLRARAAQGPEAGWAARPCRQRAVPGAGPG
jgi:transposase